MRDIRFRAWLKNAEVMEYQKNNYSLFMWAKSENQPMEIMQYTGLDDKNGKEIYEGDIYHQGDPNIKYVVIFNDCQFVGSQIGNKSLAGLTYFKDGIEIIGNIHENPDLLATH